MKRKLALITLKTIPFSTRPQRSRLAPVMQWLLEERIRSNHKWKCTNIIKWHRQVWVKTWEWLNRSGRQAPDNQDLSRQMDSTTSLWTHQRPKQTTSEGHLANSLQRLKTNKTLLNCNTKSNCQKSCSNNKQRSTQWRNNMNLGSRINVLCNWIIKLPH